MVKPIGVDPVNFRNPKGKIYYIIAFYLDGTEFLSIVTISVLEYITTITPVNVRFVGLLLIIKTV